MASWRKICCAVDFSEPSRLALEKATELARQLNAELLVVHVLPGGAPGALLAPPAWHGRPAGGEQQGLLGAWTRDAQERVRGLATSVELRGDPAMEIARVAREFGCDAVVAGTHGHGGLRRAALGSVVEAIVRRAPCPVLVVPPPT